MDEPLRAHTFKEVEYYLMVSACPSCGKGPRESQASEAPVGASQEFDLPVRCGSCGHQQDVRLRYDPDAPPDGPQVELINLGDEPSRIVDLSQWVSLFYMLTESVRGVEDGAAVRRAGFQAALCLGEALKFYSDNELPPAEAFFSKEGVAAFRAHPENFARQRLRDMQAKLPALPDMLQRLQRDESGPRRRWWQFWRR